MAENTKTLSSIAIRQSNYPHAASLVKEALQLAKTCKNDKQQFQRIQRYLDDLGYIYAATKNYDSALYYQLKAEKYVNENKHLMEEDTLVVYSALDNLYGNICFDLVLLKRYKEAEVYAKKLIILDQDILKDSLKLALAHYLLGLVYYSSNQIEKADTMAQNASLQSHNFDINFKADLFMLKANIANAKKQFKEEAIYRKQELVLKDSIYQKRLNLLKNNPFIEYERLDKKYQVELLKKDNRNQQNKTKAVFLIGILLTLLALVSLYFLWRLRIALRKRSVLYKQLQKTMAEKDATEKQLRENELFAQEMRLQMEFNESIIMQRRQISDDMHDELSNSLAALKFYVEDMKNKTTGAGAERILTDIMDEVNAVYGNARNFMHSLKTNNWENRSSLIGFLKEIQQKFSERGLMKVTLNLDEENIKLLLSTLQHDQLYHIIRESISNVIKHAKATDLFVTIGFTSTICTCQIVDNGIGFSKNQIKYGIGIQSITNRAKNLQGDLSINSLPNGMQIVVSFPLN